MSSWFWQLKREMLQAKYCEFQLQFPTTDSKGALSASRNHDASLPSINLAVRLQYNLHLLQFNKMSIFSWSDVKHYNRQLLRRCYPLTTTLPRVQKNGQLDIAQIHRRRQFVLHTIQLRPWRNFLCVSNRILNFQSPKNAFAFKNCLA